jgi:conjugal transfer pilus assembly protein TraF
MLLKVASLLVAVVFAQSACAGETISNDSLDYQSVFACDDASRFNWYCDDSNDPPKDTINKVTDQKSKEQDAQEKMDAISKDLKAKLVLSIIDPTPENVKSYIMAQGDYMDKSSTFSDVWQRVVWQNPDVNYELRRPVNNAAIKSFNSQQRQNEVNTVAQFSKDDWGLFFFFRSDCPYCHRMAPMLKRFSENYGITIFPISEDGGGLPEYPNPQADTAGLSTQLELEVVPALILGNVKDHRMITIASGLVSEEDILQRIYTLTQTKPGDSF